MCSLSGDVMLEEQTLGQKIALENCKKCQSSETAIVLRKIDVYCKSCFLAASTHKFRAMLGKYRVIKPNDKVLVIYRIGHPSTALLHMIRTGLDLGQHKRLRFEPIYLVIDENHELNKSEHTKLLSEVNDQIISYKFPVYYTSINSFMIDFDGEPQYFGYEEYIKQIKEQQNTKQKDLTRHQDISDIYRRNLTIAISKKLNCRVVLTPEISIDTAVGILGNITLGRGAHISLNIGIIDDRDPEIKIFTPLRLFESKELAYYNHFNDLDTINIYSVKEEDSAYTSVQNLMKKFVEDLQINYPSTIKTVTRTGDKLTCQKTNNSCLLCKAPIEIQVKLSSNEATEFSKWISSSQSNNINLFKSIGNGDKKYCFSCYKINRKS